MVMKAEWEKCPREDVVAQYAGIYVTLNRRGEIAMTRSTYSILGEPKAFVLLFDRTNRRIGLQPAALSTRDAYPVKVAGRCGGKKLHAYRLIREYRIDLPATVKFPDADIDEDGILRLDLRTAQIPLRVKNHWCNRERFKGEPPA